MSDISTLFSTDTSGMGVGSDIFEAINQGKITTQEYAPGTENGTIVRKLSQRAFKTKLIDHFDIMYTKRSLMWPRRNNGNM